MARAPLIRSWTINVDSAGEATIREMDENNVVFYTSPTRSDLETIVNASMWALRRIDIIEGRRVLVN